MEIINANIEETNVKTETTIECEKTEGANDNNQYNDNLSNSENEIDLKNEESIINKNNNITYYYNTNIIGKGGFAIVCKARKSNENDYYRYAIKIIDLLKYKENKKLDDFLKLIGDEITNQNSCKSKRVVEIIDNFLVDEKNKFYIVMKWYKNGSLSGLLKIRKRLTEFEVQYYIFQLIQGLKDIHEKNIVHCDIKPSNLLLDDNYCLKIGDFGLSQKKK